ncbi:motility protein A [bacterium]|nr:motility protein A [bacterium]
MDKSTLIGIVTGVLLIAISILIGAGGGAFIDIPSLLVVLGGTVAATLINFPLSDVIGVMKVTAKVMSHSSRPTEEYISRMVDISKKARTNGLLSIEEDLNSIDEDFLKISLQHVVNGTEPQDLQGIMRAELAIMGKRHKIGQKMFTAMGTYAPAFGMIGTLIGLIKMLQNLEDPAAIGPGMAMAMVTTFYGAFFANLFFLPMAGKLKQRSEEEVQFKEMILMGVLSVQAEESPRVIHNKLLSYLAPARRENGQPAESE